MRDLALLKAAERGFSINMMSSDKRWYGMTDERDGFCLELYPDTDEFKLTYPHGLLILSTDKCGSFSNDEHFNKFKKIMRKSIFNLNF